MADHDGMMRCSILFDMIYDLELKETTDLNNRVLLELRRQLPERFRKVVFLTDDEAVARNTHGWIRGKGAAHGVIPGWIEVGPDIPFTPDIDSPSVPADAVSSEAVESDIVAGDHRGAVEAAAPATS